MGCLHAGHLSLIARARRAIGPKGVIVVSIYVNPTQFGPREDFKNYPRTLNRDTALCRQAGASALFTPSDSIMYPNRAETTFSTWVIENNLTQGMEGASRPRHFRGVTTIVAKLFNIVLPDVAVFGAKDLQQAAVIQRMTRDLNFPVKIVIAPTVRESDGLAMSSRNRYLSAPQRRQATVLWKAILLARRKVREKVEGVPSSRLRHLALRFIAGFSMARTDYVEFFDPSTLQPLRQVRRGAQIALAVRIGATRLIDNARL